jgi:glycosyltransferase involved in cell wall biosynthesis
MSLNNNNIIEWWGEQEDMINVYKNSSIIVLPSFREGFPKTLIEAGLSGRPVLASDVPGCRDAIVNGITGYTFPLNDKKTYISQIINLINNKHKMKIMGQEGRKHVINNFSTDIVIPKIVAEIERSFAHAE